MISDFPWLTWVVTTALAEGFLVWYISRAKSREVIEHLSWNLRWKPILTRDDNAELFERLINGWWKLCLLLPFLSFGLLYLGDY